MISKLTHTSFYVLDQEKAYDFYVNKLGLDVRTDATMENGFRWLTVGPKDQPELEVVLMAVDGPGTMLDDETKGLFKQLLEKNKMGAGVWEATDCRAAYEELKAKGVTFLSEPKEQFYGVEAIFIDGCGNWFSMTEPAKEGQKNW